MKVIATYDPKPVPTRNYDWSAILDGYEPGDPIGWGFTKRGAIVDLLEKLEKE
jgi:hypothetical protein